jgi:hypothetical protein
MLAPLLVTLTGNDNDTEFLGKGKRRAFHLSKKGKRRAKIGAFVAAPLATAAVLGIQALRKRSKKKKAQKKARAAEAKKQQLEAQKRQAAANAEAKPTAANIQKENVATVQAAAATAAANTAATQEMKATQEAAQYENEEEQAEDVAEEAQDQQDEENADAATAADTGDSGADSADLETFQEDQGEETMGAIDNAALFKALTPAAQKIIAAQQRPTAAAFIQQYKVPIIVFGGALAIGIIYTAMQKNKA